jgi:radical SAM superfamily enzyme YgiQ (UPF0313 family)
VTVYLVNPSDFAFGIGVITPRWLYVLAASTPPEFGDPVVVDESIEKLDLSRLKPGDVVGVGVHTLNALRGYEVGRAAKERGAHVVYGGVHASMYPEEAYELGGADAVVKGDGDVVWSQVLKDCSNGGPARLYEGGRIDGSEFRPARWDLIPKDGYMWASVQTVRGCPKHCSFCSVWRMDGQKPRQRSSDAVIEEIVELRKLGFRFIALADDNFYPVTLEDLELAERQGNQARLSELKAIRQERFDLMERLSQLPGDLVFFTQITMEAAEDPEFLDAMNRAHIKGALVGIESVTKEGLKAVYKGFNSYGDGLVEKMKVFGKHGVFVLGSFIFGLPTDDASTFETTREIAQQAEVAFAQFVMLTPFPGTVDFIQWEKEMESDETRIAGHPLTRFWLIPQAQRPKLYMPHPTMTADEIRLRTQDVWDKFYSLGSVWKRSRVAPTLRSRLAFILISKLYRQMYANTGISTDSARSNRARQWARMIAKPCRKLFVAEPMPELRAPANV